MANKPLATVFYMLLITPFSGSRNHNYYNNTTLTIACQLNMSELITVSIRKPMFYTEIPL